MTTAAEKRILVVKLGALGDLIQALGPLAAIRRHHADARIVLLTAVPYAAFMDSCPLVDAVWIDRRPGAFDLGGWLALRRRLRGGGFTRVYDLQTSDRSSFYYRLFWPGPPPEWSGIAAGCSHPHANPRRDFLHSIERQAEQLAAAGIKDVPSPDLGWVAADVGRFGLTGRYALLMPGGAAHRPDKRWPATRYADLARRLLTSGVRPVLIGLESEAPLLAEVAAGAPAALDLAGQTSLAEIAVLARGAVAAVGNDTGPMHMAAVAGVPSVVLYSDASDPALCAQRGPAVTILRRSRLTDLSVDAVAAALPGIL